MKQVISLFTLTGLALILLATAAYTYVLGWYAYAGIALISSFISTLFVGATIHRLVDNE